jgi:hypothetical protein
VVRFFSWLPLMGSAMWNTLPSVSNRLLVDV